MSQLLHSNIHVYYISNEWIGMTLYKVIFLMYIQDDRYFLSGSLDGKLRLWNIPDKKVALWNEIEGVGKLF